MSWLWITGEGEINWALVYIILASSWLQWRKRIGLELVRQYSFQIEDQAIAYSGGIPYVLPMSIPTYNLARELGESLCQQGLVVTTAESCTAGGVARAITDIPGSSRWFQAGFITYSNEIKHRLLGVSNELIGSYGAVSKNVASAMMEGALRQSHSDIGVAITGIAGPGGGSDEKPVGTVCFAVGSRKIVEASQFVFKGNRQQVREQSTTKALEILLGFVSVWYKNTTNYCIKT